jgi:hypothetical protein
MPDVSSGQMALIKETVAGTTPATPAFTVLDITSEDLSQGVTNVRSAAITPQRVVKASKRAGREVGGGFSFELYKATEVDQLLAAIMGNTFVGGPPLVAKAGGSTVDTFTIERKLSATDFRRFVGFRPGMIEMTIAPEALITTRVSGVGYSMVTAATAIAGATYTAAGAADKLTALDVAAITLSNGLTTTFDYETISFSVNNQLAARKRIGPQSTRSIGAGQALVTGTARIYVPDKAFADAFIADTHFNMDIPMLFGGVGYSALFKNVAITDYNDPMTGNGDEFMGAFSFEATLDAAYLSSFAFTKTS